MVQFNHKSLMTNEMIFKKKIVFYNLLYEAGSTKAIFMALKGLRKPGFRKT